MKWGKYQMTMFYETANGDKDTIYARMFGPYINKEYYSFVPDIESRNKTKSLEIYIGGKNKKNEHIMCSTNGSYEAPHFPALINRYTIKKSNCYIQFSSSGYIKGEIQLKRIE